MEWPPQNMPPSQSPVAIVSKTLPPTIDVAVETVIFQRAPIESFKEWIKEHVSTLENARFIS